MELDEKEEKRALAVAVMLCISVFLYVCFCGCGTVIHTGHEDADVVIEELSRVYPQDNIFEEALENKIQDWSGFELDLSPETPEIK